MMTREELDNLKRLAAEATPGKSFINLCQSNGTELCLFNREYTIHLATKQNGWKQAACDAEFIAAANPLVIAELVTRLIECEEALTKLSGAASDCLINDEEEREYAIRSMKEDIERSREYFSKWRKGE